MITLILWMRKLRPRELSNWLSFRQTASRETGTQKSSPAPPLPSPLAPLPALLPARLQRKARASQVSS